LITNNVSECVQCRKMSQTKSDAMH
jgi:hypothetical protein